MEFSEPDHLTNEIEKFNLLKKDVMKIKKSKRADLERRRLLFLQIGLVLSLALILAAFEWKTVKSYSVAKWFVNTDYEIEEIAKITIQENHKPVVPVPKVHPVNFKEIENDMTEDQIEIEFTDPDDAENDHNLFPVDEPADIENEPPFFTVVEVFPEFPGGYASLQKYLTENLKYPRQAIEAGISGTVYVNFIIGSDGKIKDAKIERGIGGGCDEEALRVVKGMPSWSPGKQRNIPVNVQMVLPVKFSLIH